MKSSLQRHRLRDLEQEFAIQHRWDLFQPYLWHRTSFRAPRANLSKPQGFGRNTDDVPRSVPVLDRHPGAGAASPGAVVWELHKLGEQKATRSHISASIPRRICFLRVTLIAVCKAVPRPGSTQVRCSSSAHRLFACGNSDPARGALPAALCSDEKAARSL